MTRKLILFVAVVSILGVVAAACAQAPVIVYIVVTATPTSPGGEPIATSDGTAIAQTAAAAATSATLSTPVLQATPAGTSTPEINAMPTVTVRQIYVAEQPFQRGRMFWLEPTGQIWVMVETEPGVGLWQVYEDLFKEGDMELDPAVVPPEGLIQPIRGFGLIWRTGENVRQEIGWATDIEVGFVSNYEYHPGEGSTPTDFVPGYHFMQNQFGDWFRFNEINGTWQSVTRTETRPTATPSTPTG